MGTQIRNHSGQRTTVRVQKVLPIGLLVALEDGRTGIVRWREVAWDDDPRNSDQTPEVGDVREAVVLRDDEGGLELSLRLAERDPWEDAEEKYPPGVWVQGVVTGLDKAGVFVEVEPGIIAKLYRSQLPVWLPGDWRGYFWVGDLVRAEVRTVQPQQRSMELSLREVRARRWRDAPQARPWGPDPFALIVQEQAEFNHDFLPLLTPTNHAARTILILEDDEAQNRALADKLTGAGHHVHSAYNAPEAQALLENQSVDILLTDVGLPGVDGIQFVRDVLTQGRPLRIFLMTDWITAERRSREIADLEAQGVRLLLKPLEFNDLGVLFQDGDAPVYFSRPSELAHVVALDQGRPESVPVAERIQQVLLETRRLTGAAQAILFRLDVHQRRVEIVQTSGKTRLNENALLHLLYSPVREVLEDGDVIYIEDVNQKSAYAKHLIPLLPFRTALGTPVPCTVRDRFGLFLFHPEPGRFLRERTTKLAQGGAMVIGALLEKQVLLEKMATEQRTLLVGQLTRALVHEANHQLTPILFALEDLQSQCRRVEQELERSVEEARREMVETQKALGKLSTNLQNLLRTTKLFGRITVQDSEGKVRVDRTLARCLELVRDMADRAHVTLELIPPDQILILQAKESLLQQILLNLLINAVQQVALLRPKDGGRVRVMLGKEPAPEGGTLIRIAVEDDGPGIHRRQWNEVFELGMTTRTDGSGLGLYLAQRLCEEMHGRVYIDESAMLWGTRFVVEIPVRL